MRAICLALTFPLIGSFSTVLGQQSDDLRIEVTLSVVCDRKSHNRDTISVNYRGTFANGTEFDSSTSLGILWAMLVVVTDLLQLRLWGGLGRPFQLRPRSRRGYQRVFASLRLVSLSGLTDTNAGRQCVGLTRDYLTCA
jgi:hypothetical protein